MKKIVDEILKEKGFDGYGLSMEFNRKEVEELISLALQRGASAQKEEIIEIIDKKIKDLKRRQPKLIAETSKYAMQMSIEELEELKQKISEGK